MKKNQTNRPGPNQTKRPALPNKNGLWTWILLGVAVILLVSIYSRPDFASKEIPYSKFKEKVRAGEIQKVIIGPETYKGFKQMSPAETGAKANPLTRVPETYFVSVLVEDPDLIKLMDEKGIEYEAENVGLRNLFLHWILPFLILILIWRFLFSRAFRMGPGAGIMSFGKNRAKLVQDESKKINFNDVAGVDEAKEELQEIIEFLKTPEKFRAIGGKIPKGILLVGPPGTGKTLLARAVAGEAEVPFFSLSGSEFVEMFVGVGAARVRDLFAQAVEKSPCIIFIDELDAIGKVRSSVSPMGGHDEREQTLNQLLVEMDGFDTRTGVIIMAATNRPETLDPALLRAGRFDRQVLVDRPDVKGREEIIRLHCKNVKISEDLNLHVVAARTPGFAGADLANVVNEAALLAVRKGKQVVELADFDEAIDRVMAGLQKKTRLINEKEKKIVAHHEMGHALVTCFTKDADPVHKVSIIPRGFGALGYTLNLPKEDRYLMTQPELLARVDILLGGRVAEEIMFNEVSTGAQDDLQKATDICKRMVMEFGMSEAFGQRALVSERSSFLQGPGGPVYQKDYSEATAVKVDEEIQKLLDDAYDRVKKLLLSKKGLLEHVAAVLTDKEVIEGADLLKMIAEFEGKDVEDLPAAAKSKHVAGPAEPGPKTDETPTLHTEA
ncbi:MAG: ATP-dependent metallopeptidase FtsH/Yme1/Tma family protein [Bdellovibrionaceae bacterium]|nr:ATP-dependent zinc metalloprotease FtsH [Bdellovibrionales bacterium]MCB9254819.1 ATP-dependent metallopeptidase FtsH/Yme1/Tma family protein [Pseudobdellovibrionaceae bacterium]